MGRPCDLPRRFRVHSAHIGAWNFSEVVIKVNFGVVANQQRLVNEDMPKSEPHIHPAYKSGHFLNSRRVEVPIPAPVLGTAEVQDFSKKCEKLGMRWRGTR